MPRPNMALTKKKLDKSKRKRREEKGRKRRRGRGREEEEKRRSSRKIQRYGTMNSCMNFHTNCMVSSLPQT